MNISDDNIIWKYISEVNPKENYQIFNFLKDPKKRGIEINYN